MIPECYGNYSQCNNDNCSYALQCYKQTAFLSSNLSAEEFNKLSPIEIDDLSVQKVEKL